MSDRVAAECPSCGKVFAVASSFAGKKIRCPKCQGIIQIGGSQTPGNPASPPSAPRATSSPPMSGMHSASVAPKSEPRVARPVKPNDPPAKPTRAASAKPAQGNTRSAPAKKKRSDNYDQEQPWGDLDSYDDPANDPYADNPYASPSALPPKSKKGGATQKYKAETAPANSGGRTDGGVLVGILMMVGAVVWFFGGMALGYIFYYPPILFVLGLITTIKGALNIGK